MFTTVVVLCAVGYGVKRMAHFAKEHPEQSMEVMRWLKERFSK